MHLAMILFISAFIKSLENFMKSLGRILLDVLFCIDCDIICGIMRDVIFILLMFFVVLLTALLSCHIAHCFVNGKNWFTTPLFGDLRIMQVMTGRHSGPSWNV